MTPSAAKAKGKAPAHSPTGMRFGSEVHQLLEQVAWADETLPEQPATDAGMAVARLLENPALHDVFHLQGRRIDLFREQAADAILDGTLMSGVIDRLHLHRNASGGVERVEIIDFKTDAVQSPEELAGRYASQMAAYRSAMQLVYPSAEIECLLLSVRHGAIVNV